MVSGLIRALTRRIIRRKNESMAYPTRRGVTFETRVQKVRVLSPKIQAKHCAARDF
jgi:hypothetical protein